MWVSWCFHFLHSTWVVQSLKCAFEYSCSDILIEINSSLICASKHVKLSLPLFRLSWLHQLQKRNAASKKKMENTTTTARLNPEIPIKEVRSINTWKKPKEWHLTKQWAQSRIIDSTLCSPSIHESRPSSTLGPQSDTKCQWWCGAVQVHRVALLTVALRD